MAPTPDSEEPEVKERGSPVGKEKEPAALTTSKSSAKRRTKTGCLSKFLLCTLRKKSKGLNFTSMSKASYQVRRREASEFWIMDRVKNKLLITN